MPKVLIEVADFTPAITVPEGLDDRDDAANVVEGLAQGLANRTKHLLERTAKLDEDNVFDGSQTVTGGLAVGGTVGATNATFSGSLEVGGFAAIPHVSGDMAIENDVACHALDAVADIYAGDDVIAGNEFQYAPQPMREKMLFPQGGAFTFNDRRRIAPGGANYYHVRVPHGAALGEVRVKLTETDGAKYRIEVYRTHGINFGNGSTPTSTVVDDLVINPAGSDVENRTLTYGGLEADNDNEFYWVLVGVDADSESSIDVWAASVLFADPGPRNH